MEEPIINKDGVINSLLIAGSMAVRLEWSSWNAVCDLLPGFISKENPALHVDYYHDICGNNPSGPFIQVNIQPEHSAIIRDGEPQPQTAYHGDFIILLPNNKLLVVPSPGSAHAEMYAREDGSTITVAEQDFPWRPQQDFPLYTKWRHKNGNEYVIIGYTNEPNPGERCRPKYPVTIIYANVVTNKTYSGAAHDWHRRMTRIPG